MRPIIFSPVSDHNMPSSFYRVYMIAEQLKRRGFKTTILNPHLTDSEKRAALYALQEPSIIYIQKTGNGFHTPDNLCPLKKNHTVVFDCDDFINLNELHDMIGVADNIVCGSHFLFEYMKKFHKNTALIECCIDEERFAPALQREAKQLPRIIWSQSYADEYTQDLLSIAPVLNEVYQTTPFELMLCGFRTEPAQKMVRDALPFAVIIPYKPLDVYFRETLPLIQQADIGIVPFLDIDSRRGKAGLTLRNYMLMSIPSVASAVGEHPHIIVNGVNGYLASSLEEWHRSLKKLLSDQHKRLSIGTATHQSILHKYSLSSRVDALIDFLNSCEQSILPEKTVQIPDKKKTAAILLMRINEQDFPDNSVAALSIRNIPLVKYVEQTLMHSGLIDSVIIALPNNQLHRDYADVLRQYNMKVFTGNPDSPDVRFIEAIPPDTQFAVRLTIEKPFIDSDTLVHLIHLLEAGCHGARVDEPCWGTYVQAYQTETLQKLFNEQHQTKRLGDYFNDLPEFKLAQVSQLYKPHFSPVSIGLQSRSEIAQFMQYIKQTHTHPSVHGFMQFCINKMDEKKSVMYKHIQTQKRRITSPQRTCYVIGQSIPQTAIEHCTTQSTNPYFVCYPPQRESVLPDSSSRFCCDFLVNYGTEEYDYALFNTQKWCLDNKVNTLIALGTDTVIYTVRLSILLNIPVQCYPDKQPDPANAQLLHHLNMADKIITRPIQTR